MLPDDGPMKCQHRIYQELQNSAEHDESGALTTLMLDMLHPICAQRATMDQVLRSPFFLSCIAR